MTYYEVNEEFIEKLHGRYTIDAKKLMEHEQFDPNYINEAGTTHLQAAAEVNNTEILSELIKKGADIKAEQNQDTLKQAAYWGNNESVGVLLDAGMDIHYNDEQALRASLVGDKKETSQLLLSRDANADVAIERVLTDSTDPLKGSIKLNQSQQESLEWLRATAEKIHLKNKFDQQLKQLGQHTAQQQSTKKQKI
ncbi:hypothetical protein A9Y76_07155 [Ralstonia insidiosa]|uniref:Uncharacterized protein n=1 Tax=Ralstonia insidiosa TaxID=190721 RepID=A0A191ZVZ5_9RALS|nr:ankyrin repeat domain-containing protein [Ralstonia insidiosa]ANJ72256.1 hypothetical protein A9Y76_07155 [Ralstonia insidiosa]